MSAKDAIECRNGIRCPSSIPIAPEPIIFGCDANCHFGITVNGPVRVGICATTSSTREQAGASYWGIMELSGNVAEVPITVGTALGRDFTGLHGDGK